MRLVGLNVHEFQMCNKIENLRLPHWNSFICLCGFLLGENATLGSALLYKHISCPFLSITSAFYL